MRRPDLLGAALRLIAAGRPVFPCRPSDKAPLVERGFLAATRSEPIVHGWWVRWPGALIGMPTGFASGVVALDLDVKHGRDGVAAFDRLRAGRAMPAHPVVRTRSGGVHRYFAAPEGRPLPCSAGRLGPGVDVRGEGGYVIVPPSPGYGVEASVVEPQVPDWLLALLTPPQIGPRRMRASLGGVQGGEGARRLGALARVVAAAAQGRRNALTFWGACRAGELVAAGALDEAAAVAAIEEAARAAGLPGDEARRTTRNGVRRGLEGAGDA